MYGKNLRFRKTLTVRNSPFPAGNYMFKVNNRNTGTSLEKYSKLTIKTTERRPISRLVLLFLFANFELVSVGWGRV